MTQTNTNTSYPISLLGKTFLVKIRACDENSKDLGIHLSKNQWETVVKPILEELLQGETVIPKSVKMYTSITSTSVQLNDSTFNPVAKETASKINSMLSRIIPLKQMHSMAKSPAAISPLDNNRPPINSHKVPNSTFIEATFEKIDPPIGLINSGNGCFLNSLVQFLMNSPFDLKLLSERHFKFKKLTERCQPDPEKQISYCVDIPLRRQLKELDPSETTYWAKSESELTQEDAEEAWRVLAGDEGLEIQTTDYYKVDENTTALSLDDTQEPGYYLKLQDSTKYLADESVREKQLNLLDLPFAKDSTLETQLKKYFLPDTLKISLSEGKEQIIQEEKRLISPLPSINLKLHRSGYDSDTLTWKKFTDPISVPEFLTLKNSCFFQPEFPTPNEDKEDWKYQLRGFIQHRGLNRNEGHYVTYIQKNGLFFCCDDTLIKDISKEEFLKQAQTAYVFNYQLIEST